MLGSRACPGGACAWRRFRGQQPGADQGILAVRNESRVTRPLRISPDLGSITLEPYDQPRVDRWTHWMTLYRRSIGSASSGRVSTLKAFLNPAASNAFAHQDAPSTRADRTGSGAPAST